MYGLKRIAGACLLVYAVLYTAQVLFHRFYEDAFSPQVVWDVFNVITAVGILIAIAVALAHMRKSTGDAEPDRRFTANIGLYASLPLALMFFPRWFSLLMGDVQSEANNVAWLLVSVLNPLVLAHAGLRLWSTPRPE